MLIAALLLAQSVSGPLDVYGDWIIPPDEEGGPTRGTVTISEEDGAPIGRISEIGDVYKDDPEAEGSIGLTILWGFEADKDGDKWKSGRILDPEADKEYKAKIARDGDNLSVKGCIAFFCREQIWLPAAPANPAAPVALTP